MSFLSPQQLESLGFAALGKHVLISDKASIHNAAGIRIGDHVRIDDFCVLSAGAGGITLGSYIHVACFCSLIGAAEIVMEDFSGLSSRVSIYSSSDDYSGRHLTNPTVPHEFTQVDSRPVRLGRHVIIGAGSVILPGVTLHEGCAVGALSLVKSDGEAFSIYMGVPAKCIASRKRELLEKEALFKQKLQLDDDTAT